jgi:hypothetical protein
MLIGMRFVVYNYGWQVSDLRDRGGIKRDVSEGGHESSGRWDSDTSEPHPMRRANDYDPAGMLMFCAEQGEGLRSHRPRIDVTRMRHNEGTDAARAVLDLAMGQQILHGGLKFVWIGRIK